MVLEIAVLWKKTKAKAKAAGSPVSLYSAATRPGKLTAQAGKPVNCAETDAARKAATKTVREYMANVGTIEYEKLVALNAY